MISDLRMSSMVLDVLVLPPLRPMFTNRPVSLTRPHMSQWPRLFAAPQEHVSFSSSADTVLQLGPNRTCCVWQRRSASALPCVQPGVVSSPPCINACIFSRPKAAKDLLNNTNIVAICWNLVLVCMFFGVSPSSARHVAKYYWSANIGARLL